jgi:hypothetical protein
MQWVCMVTTTLDVAQKHAEGDPALEKTSHVGFQPCLGFSKECSSLLVTRQIKRGVVAKRRSFS